MRYPVFLLTSSIIAFVVVIYFFCPRFVIWKGLGLGTPISYSNPEVNRALFTFKKIENPFQFYVYPPTQNATANWRMLFPLLGHYWHIPKLLFLCLPHLGCMLALALITHLVCQTTGDRLLALGTVVLLGATGWFFVSTGWLTYFDSWYILGLMIVGFVPSTWAMGVACFLSPWVDERFVVALPLTLIVRAVYYRRFLQFTWRSYTRGAIIAVLIVGAYVGIRLASILGGIDLYPAKHVSEYNELAFASWLTVEGHWSGLRAGWFFVAVFWWLTFSFKNRWWGIALAISSFAMLVFLLRIGVSDVSRSVCTLLPCALLGVLLLWQARRTCALEVVYCAMAFNLLSPAAHGLNTWRLPINNLYTEIEHYKNPPDYLNPAALNQYAVQLAQKGDFTNSFSFLSQALYLKAKYPEALLNRGVVRRQLGDLKGATEDLTKALQICPRDWPQRVDAMIILKQIEQQQQTPPPTAPSSSLTLSPTEAR